MGRLEKGGILNLSLQYKVRSSGLFSLARFFHAEQIAPGIIENLFSRPLGHRVLSVYRNRPVEPRRYEVGSVRSYYLKAS